MASTPETNQVPPHEKPVASSDAMQATRAGDVTGEGGTSPFSRVEPPSPVVVAAEPVVVATPSTDDAPKRGRGRPRKVPVAESGGPTISLPGDAVVKAASSSVKALFVDSKRAAGTITVALDGALMALARVRYGEMADQAAITDAERKELIDAWEAFLKATGTQLSPGAALVVAVGGVYATRAVGLEMAFRASRAE